MGRHYRSILFRREREPYLSPYAPCFVRLTRLLVGVPNSAETHETVQREDADLKAEEPDRRPDEALSIEEAGQAANAMSCSAALTCQERVVALALAASSSAHDQSVVLPIPASPSSSTWAGGSPLSTARIDSRSASRPTIGVPVMVQPCPRMKAAPDDSPDWRIEFGSATIPRRR
jgi:hypothetical protein